MEIDDDLDEDEDDEEEGGILVEKSSKGTASYAEQKRRAATWAAENLKGPSGKKEKNKVCKQHLWQCLCRCLVHSVNMKSFVCGTDFFLFNQEKMNLVPYMKLLIFTERTRCSSSLSLLCPHWRCLDY